MTAIQPSGDLYLKGLEELVQMNTSLGNPKHFTACIETYMDPLIYLDASKFSWEDAYEILRIGVYVGVQLPQHLQETFSAFVSDALYSYQNVTLILDVAAKFRSSKEYNTAQHGAAAGKIISPALMMLKGQVDSKAQTAPIIQHAQPEDGKSMRMLRIRHALLKEIQTASYQDSEDVARELDLLGEEVGYFKSIIEAKVETLSAIREMQSIRTTPGQVESHQVISNGIALSSDQFAILMSNVAETSAENMPGSGTDGEASGDLDVNSEGWVSLHNEDHS